jgi:hypothetical protein
LQNTDLNEPQNDLETQLMTEREQHTVTKRLLQSEHQKVCQLNEELNESRLQSSTLTAAHRLNAAAFSKTIRTIEPKIDYLVKKADMLIIDKPSNVENKSGELPDGAARRSKTPDLPEQVPRQQVNKGVDLSPPVDLLGDLGEFPSLDEVL